MADFVRFGRVQLTPESEAKLRRFLANPKQRRAASAILNREGRILQQACTDLADGEIRRRPEERQKNTLSQGHGKHYNDSFVALPASAVGPDKMRIVIKNTHPAHKYVEHGTAEHQITPRKADGALLFPFNGLLGGGGPRKQGPWALTSQESGGFYFLGQAVSHPGAVPHQIMRRVLREYRRTAQRRLRSNR